MNNYTPKTPRAALGLAAAAMATITMAAMVVLPAELETAGPAEEAATLAADGTADAFVAYGAKVSEERGELSLAVDGVLHRRLDEGALRDWLARLLVLPGRPRRGLSALLSRWGRTAPRREGAARPPAGEDGRAAL